MRPLSLLIFIAMLSNVYAQSYVQGTVQDTDGQGISFASVALVQAQDSSLVEGAVSDEHGKFSLKAQPGDYLLRVNRLEYKAIFTSLTISEESEQNIGVFHLAKAPQQLDEVVVKAKKPLFERQVDRTIVNVKSSVTSAGGTVLDILEKSPGVQVNRQNNTLAMSGKNGVSVMINGKISRLPTEAVVQMLNGMSAANVEKIELITTPPAKYDAEGNGGIIHLVMEENENAGTNGNFGVTAGYNRGETWGLNGSLNHRRGRINTFLNYSILSDRNVHLRGIERFVTGDDFVQINRSSTRRVALTQNYQLKTSAANKKYKMKNSKNNYESENELFNSWVHRPHIGSHRMLV